MGSTSHDTEKILLRQIANGSIPAFGQLVDHYWKKVYGNTLALTKSPQTAEELTQDIFLRIWQQRDRLADVENFSVYLYVVGRNQVISAMRKKILATVGDVPDIIEDVPSPEQQLELKETRDLMMAGIEAMPAVRRKVFKMSRIDGMSYDEIAAALGISRNTVKEHIVTALGFLRAYMQHRSDKTLGVILLALHWFR